MKKMITKIYDKLTRRLKNKVIEDMSIKNKEILSEYLKDINYKLDVLVKESNYPKYDFLPFLKDSNKPKILITGFYGGGSLGDELMLETLVDRIDQDKFEITVMLSPNEQFDITRYKDVKMIYTPVKLYEIYQIGDYYDAVICGGGAILDDWYYLLESYHMTFTTTIINLLNYFATNDKMIIAYGVRSNNILTNADFIKKLNYIISKAEHFSLGDKHSLKSLEKAGIDTTKVEIVDDIVFASEKLLTKLKKADQKKIKVMISFNLQDATKKQNTKVVVDLIKYFEKNKIEDYEINIFPYFTYKNWDYPFLEKIKNQVNNDKVIIGKTCHNFNDLLEVINKYDYFVSTRYHMALILNAIGKRFMLLNYDKHRHYINKNKYLYENYGFENNIINISDLSKIEDNYKQLFSLEKGKRINNDVIKNASKKMDKVLRNLDRLIKDNN